MTASKRETELDILRLLSMLAVIAIHGAGGLGITISGHSFSLHAATVWCVPAFFMISGRFFLDPGRDVTLRKLLTKYVPHIAVAFVFWSAVYTVYYVVSGSYAGLNVFGILTQFVEGPYHFWYLYVLIGLYLLTPFLRKIAENRELLIYFTVLFVILNITFEYLVYVPKVGTVIEMFAKKFGLDMVTGYVGYFMLGWFLCCEKDKITGKAEITVYIVAVLLMLATVAADNLLPADPAYEDFVKQYMKPNVVFYSAALYLFFVKRVSRIDFSEGTKKFFGLCTELGFGIYCSHALVNELLGTWRIPGVIRVLLIYLICFGITWLIRRIPLVGKKIT